MMIRAPYGTWASPITAKSITKNVSKILDVIVDPITSEVYHIEGRPSEGGRSVLVHTATGRDIVGSGWNVRTMVQEYGGAASIVHGGLVYFSNLTDGRVYRVGVKKHSEAPEAITPEGKPYRYACLEPLPHYPHLLAAILEDHTIDLPSKIETSLVIIDTKSKSLSTLVSGADFYAIPKFSPNGKRIAWCQWSHPDMPWEGGEVYVADVNVSEDSKVSIGKSTHVSGEKEVIAAGYPSWANDERLIFISDESGFMNPYKFENSRVSPLLSAPVPEDFGSCLWLLDFFPYAILDEDGKYAIFSAWRDGRNVLYLVDLDVRSEPKLIENPFAVISGVRSASKKNHQGVILAQKEDEDYSIVQFSLVSLDKRLELHAVKPALPLKVDGVSLASDVISLPQALTLKGLTGEPLHVIYHPPRNPNYSGTSVEGEKPPCVIDAHGGPTSLTHQGLNWTKQYFTTRGWAWLSVNYSGSSGYGRKYIERLQGKWGVSDVEDCILAARTLASENKLIDPKRTVIRGGSAGGFTTLAALSVTSDNNVFAAATSLYGISDLTKLAEFTHKFESRYLDHLIGGNVAKIPDVFKERSPVNHADRIVTPLLILQGELDMVVPKGQAETIYNSIKERGGDVEYKLYPGEGHGWRQENNMRDALERELGFYERVLGLKK